MSRGPVGSPLARVGNLPKASTPRRLLGSGIEFLAYSMAAGFFTAVGLAFGGLLGLLWVPLMLAVVASRDLNSGSFSLGKRIGSMRVVDIQTAEAASNVQALTRNSYYLVLIFLMIVPLAKIAVEGFFLMLVAIDTMMVIASDRGRRLGDFLAGTQVVPVAGGN
ncbi:MAG: RDD family protein [Acidobacteriota bacterium]